MGLKRRYLLPSEPSNDSQGIVKVKIVFDWVFLLFTEWILTETFRGTLFWYFSEHRLALNNYLGMHGIYNGAFPDDLINGVSVFI